MALRWPWASRDALEVQRLFNAHLVNELAKEQAKSAHLLETVLSMRMSGGAIARLSPLPEGRKLTQPRRSAVDQAIDENKHASSRPGLRQYLASWATKELEKGTTEATVLNRLRTWSIAEDDDEDVDDDDDDVIPVEPAAAPDMTPS